jgi:hypothetical protein
MRTAFNDAGVDEEEKLEGILDTVNGRREGDSW